MKRKYKIRKGSIADWFSQLFPPFAIASMMIVLVYIMAGIGNCVEKGIIR